MLKAKAAARVELGSRKQSKFATGSRKTTNGTWLNVLRVQNVRLEIPWDWGKEKKKVKRFIIFDNLYIKYLCTFIYNICEIFLFIKQHAAPFL